MEPDPYSFPLSNKYNKKSPFNVKNLPSSFSIKNGPSYRHRQIRIMQIRTTASKVITNQVVVGNDKNLAGKNSIESLSSDLKGFLKVEASKAIHPRENNSKISKKKQKYIRETQKIVNEEPLHFQEYFALTDNPKKSILWMNRKQNADFLPKKFIQKEAFVVTLDNKAHLEDENASKSVNLLSKQKLRSGNSPNQEKDEKRVATTSKKFRRQPDIPRKTFQQLAEQQRKTKLEIKRQISMDYAKPFNPPANISAYSYIIYEPEFSNYEKKRSQHESIKFQNVPNDMKVVIQKKYRHSHKVIASLNSRNSVEVASLTKIMTCLVALQLCQKFNIDAEKEKIKIGKFQSNISGTSAQLSEGETYSLEDLYHGLMLPSGNDASIALAVWGGRLLLKTEKPNETCEYKKKQCYYRFITEMNSKGKQLGLLKTNYANSHGLVNSANKSCAYDLAILCQNAMKNTKFKKIVGCKMYKTQITCQLLKSNLSLSQKKSSFYKGTKLEKNIEEPDEQEEGEEHDLNESDEQIQDQEYILAEKDVSWENTHKLVQEKSSEYIGIKTGITTAAGPCLASCIRTRKDRYFIIVVLGCDKMSMRFKDTENLKKWLYNRESLQSPKKKSTTNEQSQYFQSLAQTMRPVNIVFQESS